MKILFAGTPAIAAKTLVSLLTDPRFSQFEVVGVLTREDAPIGRKRIMTASPVAQVASEHGIPVLKANRIDSATELAISQIGADFAVVIAFGVLLKASTLNLMPLGWFNLHFSLLPHLRGAAPVQRALINGDKETGVTLFQLDEGMDTGPIAGSVPAEIQPGETAGELLDRLRNLGDSLLAECLPQIANEQITLTPQPSTGATLAPKLARTETEINWAKSAFELANLIAGANPEPMAHTQFSGSSFRILRARAITNSMLQDGEFSSRLSELARDGEATQISRRVFVKCGSGYLELIEVQPSGKTPMSALDWSRGVKLPTKLGVTNE